MFPAAGSGGVGVCNNSSRRSWARGTHERIARTAFIVLRSGESPLYSLLTLYGRCTCSPSSSDRTFPVTCFFIYVYIYPYETAKLPTHRQRRGFMIAVEHVPAVTSARNRLESSSDSLFFSFFRTCLRIACDMTRSLVKLIWNFFLTKRWYSCKYAYQILRILCLLLFNGLWI